MPSAGAERRRGALQQVAEADAADAELGSAAAAAARNAQPAAGWQQPVEDRKHSTADRLAEPLRSVPDSLTKELQGATFEASPLGTTRVDSSQQPQQEGTTQPAEKPADAWERKRRRLSRRYARAAKQWRKLTRRQQQQPGAQPAPTFRTAPLAGISADQPDADGQPSTQQAALAAPHAADQTPHAAAQPSVMPSHDDSQGRTHTGVAAQHPQQQSAQDTGSSDLAQPQPTAADSRPQDTGGPAGWGLPQHAAPTADDQSSEAAAEEAAATAARQQQALQRAEELRVTDTLQPPPPLHDSLSRTSSGRIKARKM
jgi:hypothetical protein